MKPEKGNEPSSNGFDRNHIEFEIVDSLVPADSEKKCIQLRSCLSSCTRPCLAETYPLPPGAACPRRCLDNFLCPPHSRMGAVMFMVLVALAIWAALFSLTGDQALPKGNLFSLFVLFVACWCGGYVVKLIKLPPLLGMLLVGGVLGNAPYINVAKDINATWLFSLRQIALTIILTRAGLGLDPKALRRLSFVVVRLAFLPCLAETFVDGIASHLILGFPWPWGFMLGFVIAAVSPAVIVPSLLGLGEKGYGVDKGIPTLVIAAASIDDVLAITGFGVLLGITFSTGDIVWTLFKGPLEVIAGTLFGIVGGVILWYIPQKSSKHLVLFRATLLLALGLVGIFGSIKLHWSGAGPLAALTLPFVAALQWRSEFKEGEENPLEKVVGVLWMIFQPFLFGLIGAEVDLSNLDADIIGLGIGALFIGLVVRICVSFLSVFFTNLNMKERLFVAVAWLPKATVQAAIGTIAYDLAKKKEDEVLQGYGKQVLNLAVLAILITAPLGSFLISILGPLLLDRPTLQDIELNCPKENENEVNKPLKREEEEDEDADVGV